MIPTLVATLATVALLVPVLLTGSTDGADLARSRALPRSVDSDEGTRTSDPVIPSGEDLRSLADQAGEDIEYVAASDEVAQASEPQATETAEPEPEPEPTQTAEPEPEPAQTEQSTSSSGGAYTSPDGQYTYEHSIETWERLAQCESNGDWSINTGNGYYGGLQFSKGSWDAVGGSGYPHENSKWEQIHRGELLQDQQGWGAWPECSRKVGLR